MLNHTLVLVNRLIEPIENRPVDIISSRERERIESKEALVKIAKGFYVLRTLMCECFHYSWNTIIYFESQ